MTLQAEEFIRRFLLHVLPEGFQRIRYYGFLANRYREQKLAPSICFPSHFRRDAGLKMLCVMFYTRDFCVALRII